MEYLIIIHIFLDVYFTINICKYTSETIEYKIDKYHYKTISFFRTMLIAIAFNVLYYKSYTLFVNMYFLQWIIHFICCYIVADYNKYYVNKNKHSINKNIYDDYITFYKKEKIIIALGFMVYIALVLGDGVIFNTIQF